MKYLFIGAHPDDIEFSCGGTMARLVDEGHDVYMMVMTGGGASLSGNVNERICEQHLSYGQSGCKGLFILDYEDGAIRATAQTIREISNNIDSLKPDFVITHYPEDSHQDHREVAAIVRSATRRKYSLLYFDSYSSENFKANLFVDISAHIDGKTRMLGAFNSQIAKYEERGVDFIGKALTINKLNGYECRAYYAEGYSVECYMI